MFLRKLFEHRGTVAFRLTLWYASIFTLSMVLVFVIFYLMLVSGIRKRTDAGIMSNYREYSGMLTSGEGEDVGEEMLRDARYEGEDQCFFRLSDLSGRVIVSSNMSAWRGIDKLIPPIKPEQDNQPRIETVSFKQHQARVLQAVVGKDRILQIGQSLAKDERLLENFKTVFATSILLAMALAAAVGWFMARRAISGVNALTRTAGEIASGAFDKRVPHSGRGDEIDRMATTFNLMLERIQMLISKMREITDNIAHDLRSPITRIRGAAEMALTGGAPLAEYETVTASTIEECDRLLGLINTMLEISEAEAGMVKLKVSTFDLAEMSRDACELFEPVAEDKGVVFSYDAATPTFIEGDLQKLQRALANLLDNAIKYTPSGKTVRVAMEHDERNARIIIEDRGIGISPQDLPHIFERFYRGDQSRSQTGNGLGLCLSQAIAKAHHGVITVDSELGQRSTFVISLPRKMSGASALKQD